LIIRHFKSKKAISPILATLLLIVIAVAAIVVTYAWIMTYMGGLQKNIMLYKENIAFYGTPTDAARNRVNFTAGNSGTTTTQIARIYIGNSSGYMIDVTDHSDIGTGKTLNGGSATTITVNWPNALASEWEPGKVYYFKVIPKDGQYLEIQEQAPVS
jgi:flagellin-like protein